jgi:hypothetical protein
LFHYWIKNQAIKRSFKKKIRLLRKAFSILKYNIFLNDQAISKINSLIIDRLVSFICQRLFLFILLVAVIAQLLFFYQESIGYNIFDSFFFYLFVQSIGKNMSRI